MTTPTQTQTSYHDIMLAVMRALTPAHSLYENAWAVAWQSVHAEIWHMHQNFVTEKEADMRACAKLTSELHRALHEHRLATKERARLDAELMKVVSGCFTLKTQMPGVMTEALRRGLEELADGSSARFAEISRRIDADLQDRIGKLFSDVLKTDAALQGDGETDALLRQRLKISYLASTSTPVLPAEHVPDPSPPNERFSNGHSQVQGKDPTPPISVPLPVIAREFDVRKGVANKESMDLAEDNSRPPTPVMPFTQARPSKRRRKSKPSPRQGSIGLPAKAVGFALGPVNWERTDKQRPAIISS